MFFIILLILYLLININNADIITMNDWDTYQISNVDLINGMTFTQCAITTAIHSLSGPISVLTNGLGPLNQDNPPSNYFASDSNNVRIQIDLLSTTLISDIRVFSWHIAERAQQTVSILLL